MTARQGVILFGHGARDPAWAGPMQRMSERMREMAPELEVALAFLELMSPSLAEAAEALIAGGCRRLVVVPVFLAQGGHLKRDLPALLAEIAARHPQVEFRLEQAVGEAEPVVAAIADYACACARVS
jgi:sirohydrochlorin cobaltochelatase